MENNMEVLFDELISVKLLHHQKKEKLRKGQHPPEEKGSLQKDLLILEQKIRIIENAIARYGESFLDVYDAELLNSLSETDIIDLRDEIREVKNLLEAMKIL